VKAWAERPESTDEDEDSGSDHVQPIKDKNKLFARKFTKRVKSTRIKKDDKDDMKTNRRGSLFTLRHTNSNPISASSYSDTENQDGKVSFAKPLPQKDKMKTKRRRSLFPVRQTQPNPISASSYSDTENQDGKVSFEKHHRKRQSH
jgi:hypothetical protein